MIKVFERSGKLNVVDDRNVVVGFDYQQDCCENFGHSITDSNGALVGDDDMRLAHYHFNAKFVDDIEDGEDYEDGGSAHFQLVSDDPEAYPPLILKLYNSHNGWYGHGFSMAVGNESVRSDVL